MSRTHEQKRAFVDECLRIEKDGGNVLEYIAQNWPSYTPRATWYNLQKQFLNRRPNQLTEGKPKGSERMSKMLEVAQEAVEAAKAGGNVFSFLRMRGYKNPSSTWYMLKQQAKKHYPELYEKMCRITIGAKKAIPEPGKKGTGENPSIDQKAAETVFFGGKPYEKMEKAEQNAPETERNTGDHVSADAYRNMRGEIRDPEKKPPACCAPNTRNGVEVPDELPVCAVKSKVAGKWELARQDGFVHLIYQETQCLSLHADNWLKLAEEIPMMLKQLGLK